MDQELKAYLDDLRSSMEERFRHVEERFRHVEESFRHVEESFRHTEILIEGVRHEVRFVAEGVDAGNEKLAAFQADTARRFEEVQSSFTPYVRNVNGRLGRLEDDVPALERRVTALETRASRRAGKKPPTQ